MFENNDNDDPFDPCSDKYDIFLTLKFNNCYIVLIYSCNQTIDINILQFKYSIVVFIFFPFFRRVMK